MATIEYLGKEQGEHKYKVRVGYKNPSWRKGSTERRYLQQQDTVWLKKRSKKQIELYALKWKEQLETDAALKEKKMDFPVFFERWMNTFKIGKFSTGNDLIYRRTLRYVKKYFSGVVLEDMTRLHYQEFLDKLAEVEELAKATVQTYHSKIRACFNYVVEEDILRKNPTRRAIIRGKKPKNEEETYLEINEAQQLERMLLDDFMISVFSRVLFIQLRTGMRISEVLGLTANRIDFEKNTIKVDRQWHAEDKKFGPVKNKKIRFVDISSTTAKQLSIIIKLNKRVELKSGMRNKEGFLFPSERLSMRKPVSYQKSLGAIKKYGRKLFLNDDGELAKDISTHVLRHTRGSMLLRHGYSEIYIADQLGDEIKTVQDHYIHLLKELRTESAQKLDKIGL